VVVVDVYRVPDEQVLEEDLLERHHQAIDDRTAVLKELSRPIALAGAKVVSHVPIAHSVAAGSADSPQAVLAEHPGRWDMVVLGVAPGEGAEDALDALERVKGCSLVLVRAQSTWTARCASRTPRGWTSTCSAPRSPSCPTSTGTATTSWSCPPSRMTSAQVPQCSSTAAATGCPRTSRPVRRPGGQEWCGDGVDSDCDGRGGPDDDDDEDGDGLTWSQEDRLGTSDCSLDSDGDGLEDGDELQAGTDPADPDTDGDGLEDGQDDHPLEARRRCGCASGPEGASSLALLLVAQLWRRSPTRCGSSAR